MSWGLESIFQDKKFWRDSPQHFEEGKLAIQRKKFSPEGAPWRKKSGCDSCQALGNHSWGFNWIVLISDSSASVREISKFGNKTGSARRFCISTWSTDWFEAFLRPSRTFSGERVTEVIFQAAKSLTERFTHPSARHNCASNFCKREKLLVAIAEELPSTRVASVGSREFLERCSPKIMSKRKKRPRRINLGLFFWAGTEVSVFLTLALDLSPCVGSVPCKQTQPSLSFHTERVSHWL